MMMTELQESIKVGAVFNSEQGIIPKWFVWDGQKHTVERVAFACRVRQGRGAYHHFAVVDGTTLYELTYNAATLDWKLMAVSPM